jgi:integrase
MRQLHGARNMPIHPQIHDFRRTAATNLALCGTSPHIVERILKHSTGQIRDLAAVYNRWACIKTMRAALNRYHEPIASLGGRHIRAISVGRPLFGDVAIC